MLNPECKLIYFRIAGWEFIWIEEAKKLVYNTYNSNYAPPENIPDPDPVPETTEVRDACSNCVREYKH